MTARKIKRRGFRDYLIPENLETEFEDDLSDLTDYEFNSKWDACWVSLSTLRIFSADAD